MRYCLFLNSFQKVTRRSKSFDWKPKNANRFFLGPDKHPRADGLGFSVERTKWARSKNPDPSWGNAEAWDWNLWLERSESHKLAIPRGCLSGPRKNILSCKQSRGPNPLQNCPKKCSSDRPFGQGHPKRNVKKPFQGKPSRPNQYLKREQID